MAIRIERCAVGGTLAVGLLIALAGCDQLISRLAIPLATPLPGQEIAAAGPSPGPAKDTATPSSAPRPLQLAPAALRLNVPSDEPCPCPFESTASFDVGAAPGASLRWTVSDDAIASVSAAGLVSARATGTTLVTLEADGWIPATASIDVVDQGGRAAVTLQ